MAPPLGQAQRCVRDHALALLVAVTAVAAVSSTWVGHVDLGDADVYRVIARNMVQDGEWIRLRYLPGVHTPFFEHLPFGFWPLAGSLRVFGEVGPNLISACYALATVMVVYVASRRCNATHEAALLASLLLTATPDFHARAGHPYLDQPLMLFATAAVVPILDRARMRWHSWLAATVLLSGAIAIKGPFGAVPFAGVMAARALLERDRRLAVMGVVAVAVASLPSALFVLLQPDWLEHFGRRQVLASATGARADGQLGTLYPLLVILGHFWPGLALVGPAAWSTRRFPGGSAKVLGLGTAFAIGALCLPARKIWTHALVVFPLAAVFIGVALSPLLAGQFAPWVKRYGRGVLCGVALLAIPFAILGGGRASLRPPCFLSTHFADEAGRFRAGEAILIIDQNLPWSMLASLASHHSVVPVLLRPENRDALLERYGGARWMLTSETCEPVADWIQLKRAAGWTLCLRNVETKPPNVPDG